MTSTLVEVPFLVRMIPRLPSTPNLHLVSAFIDALLKNGVAGDVGADDTSRATFATDNSIYRLTPLSVLFPRNAADVVRLVQLASRPRFRSLVFAPRGGGTGTNGQSLTTGIVVDLSRHMTCILEIDPIRRMVRVEASVVKDQLNAALELHGLFFAPELSTSNRATIGGLAQTRDACEARSDGPAYTLMPHCTEQAIAAPALTLWKSVFASFGLDLAIADTGCCGMAGTFGHEARHRSLSSEIYRLSWQARLRRAPGRYWRPGHPAARKPSWSTARHCGIPRRS